MVVTVYELYTHSLKNMAIPAIAYFIITLDSQRSGLGRIVPNYLKLDDFFLAKICTSIYKVRYIFCKKGPQFSNSLA